MAIDLQKIKADVEGKLQNLHEAMDQNNKQIQDIERVANQARKDLVVAIATHKTQEAAKAEADLNQALDAQKLKQQLVIEIEQEIITQENELKKVEGLIHAEQLEAINKQADEKLTVMVQVMNDLYIAACDYMTEERRYLATKKVNLLTNPGAYRPGAVSYRIPVQNIIRQLHAWLGAGTTYQPLLDFLEKAEVMTAAERNEYQVKAWQIDRVE